jgi:hypothetical protein
MASTVKPPHRHRALSVVNGLLCFALALQSALAACLALWGQIPLPTSWTESWVREQLPPGFDLRFKSVALRPASGLHFTDLRFSQESIGQTLLQSSGAAVSVDWRARTIERLALANGTVFIPSVYSPSGRSEALLQQLSLQLSRSPEGWVVENFAARHESIVLRGRLPLPRLAPSDAPADFEGTLRAFFRQAAELVRQRDRLQAFKEPTITLLAERSGDALRADWQVSSERLTHDRLQADAVRLRGALRADASEISTDQPTHITLDRFSAPELELSGQHIALRLSPQAMGRLLNGQWPDFKGVAGELRRGDLRLSYPVAQVDLRAYPELRFRGSARLADGHVTVSGATNVATKTADLKLAGQVRPLGLLPPDWLARLPGLQLSEGLALGLELRLGPGYQLERALWDLQTGPSQLDALTFEGVEARGELGPDQIRIDELYLDRGHDWLRLALDWDRRTDDYAVRLTGSVDPKAYDALLPRWWEAIFRDFDFRGATHRHGDFMIRGNRSRRAADLYFGRAAATGIRYRGVELLAGDLIVEGRGPFVALRDLNVSTPSGEIRGSLSFTSRLDEVRGPMAIRCQLEGRLSLGDLSLLLEEDLRSSIEPFATGGSPLIRFEGLFFDRAYAEFSGLSRFRLRAESATPITYHGVPFEFLRFDLHGRPEKLHLRGLAFGYAQGKGSGAIDISLRGEASPFLDYRLQLEGANRKLALGGLPDLESLEAGLTAPAAEQEAADPPGPSALDFTLAGSGPSDAPLAHRGAGRFTLQDPELGTIQLLGPLSRFLQSTQLNFTSFNLDRMTGELRYADGLASFDSLIIDGPRTSIEAPGTVRLSDRSLDLDLTVSLLANAGNADSRIRQIGDLIVTPLPNLLRFEMTGTVDEPKIRSLFDPRNLMPRL